ELHDGLNEPATAELLKALAAPDTAKGPYANAAALREPIFYSAESAYTFQYRNLSVEKYARDTEWLQTHKGFTLDDARKVVVALLEFLNGNLLQTLINMKNLPPNDWSFLSGFQFAVADIAAKSDLPEPTVNSIVDAFTCPEDGNPTFTSLNEFNAVNALPI